MNSIKPEQQTKPWQAALKTIMVRALREPSSGALWQKYNGLFSADYQAFISPRYALNDILQIERLIASKRETVDLIKPCSNYPHYRLHFYGLQERYLDEFIPVLENMGLRIMDQVQFAFRVDEFSITLKSFTVKPARDRSVPFKQSKHRLLECLQMVMDKRVENDSLNKLCVLAGMDWRGIDLLRAYRNYCLQLGQRTTIASIHHALINNPQVATGLFDYFDARFRPNPEWQEPTVREELVLFPLRLQLLSGIDSVSDINDDRILRTMFNLIDATVRSNFYRSRPPEEYFIAFKINSIGVIDMPMPKPLFEIYVHAFEMEGIHLRGGKISRGGIRWSDRLDDFRTEILGLMQTQINKNALIIPTGAKGGFIVKAREDAGSDLKSAGKKAYIKLIKGLLDLTDSYHDNEILSPEGMVIHDDPDPYLVVAADKGTAQFSDTANAVAAEYRFWLGDAFASGGSQGYDHKALGITARGAWECVKRHFREIGKDIQQEAFTVIGIGSMDGDVFGNGMLLSPHIRLLAAFSGQHIFIDPTPPDNGQAFNERRRLFELPGSTWLDYDRNLISEGGGVYSRSSKDIPVSAALKKWLGIRYKTIDGETLIRHLLVAPVELLWLGGIGTYVKASSEKHEDVGDRGNDNVRVDACNLSAKVVGEGANLGFTQKARIEYSLHGGRINTDAVDNSAGVDTSDHEVNLKILLNVLEKKGLISDYRSLFTEMTEAVCRLVLDDNIAQSLCLSLEQIRSKENLPKFLAVAERLEAAGYLDREVESFAQNKEILARPGQVITRPELADLMAAGKMYLTQVIQSHAEQLSDDCYVPYLNAYFPAQIGGRFEAHLSSHPLEKEIKATVGSNKIINQAGCGFLSLADSAENGLLWDAANCYLAFDQILQADGLRQAIDDLSGFVSPEYQYQLLERLEHTLLGFCRWSLSNDKPLRPDKDCIYLYQQRLKDYETYRRSNPDQQEADMLQQCRKLSLPEDLAQKLAFIYSIPNFLFAVQLATETGQRFTSILKVIGDLDIVLGLSIIQQQLGKVPLGDHWQQSVHDSLQTDIQRYTGQLVEGFFSTQAESCAAYFEEPVRDHCFKQYKKLFQEIQSSTPYTLYPFICLIRILGELAMGQQDKQFPLGT